MGVCQQQVLLRSSSVEPPCRLCELPLACELALNGLDRFVTEDTDRRNCCLAIGGELHEGYFPKLGFGATRKRSAGK